MRNVSNFNTIFIGKLAIEIYYDPPSQGSSSTASVLGPLPCPTVDSSDVAIEMENANDGDRKHRLLNDTARTTMSASARNGEMTYGPNEGRAVAVIDLRLHRAAITIQAAW